MLVVAALAAHAQKTGFQPTARKINIKFAGNMLGEKTTYYTFDTVDGKRTLQKLFAGYKNCW